MFTKKTEFKSVCVFFSGSQTFPVRGPLRIISWSAKHKILSCIGIRGPLRQISRTLGITGIGLRKSDAK